MLSWHADGTLKGRGTIDLMGLPLFPDNFLIPGTPKDSGISLQAVLELGPIMPLFGVCMGHQCIGEAFGGRWLWRLELGWGWIDIA